MRKVTALTSSSARCIGRRQPDQNPMTCPVTNYDQSSDRYVGKLVYLHYNVVSLSLPCGFVSLRLNLKSGEAGDSPGFGNRKAGVRSREHVASPYKHLVRQSYHSIINLIEEKRRMELYRGAKNVLGGMKKGDGAEQMDPTLGCEGHEVRRRIYCLLAIGHFLLISRSNMPLIQGGCEARTSCHLFSPPFEPDDGELSEVLAI